MKSLIFLSHFFLVGLAYSTSARKLPLVKKLSEMPGPRVRTEEGHFIQPRQVNDNENNQIPTECSNEFTLQSCQTGYIEQLVHQQLDCGCNDVEMLATFCDKNEAGEVCGMYENDAESNKLLSAARKDCMLRESLRNELQGCPSKECAVSLQVVHDSPAGCCINAMYNDSYIYDFEVDTSDPVFNYGLWSQCGVEPFQQCEQTISRRTPLPNATCTDEELYRQYYTLECSELVNTIIAQIEEMEGCSNIRQLSKVFNPCFVNSREEFCLVLMLNENVTAGGIASEECNVNQTSCSSRCKEGLEIIQNELDCCFNLFYNNTNSLFSDIAMDVQDEQFLASYTLWNQCGVETPPLTCRNLLLSKGYREGFAILTLMIALTLAMWNN